MQYSGVFFYTNLFVCIKFFNNFVQHVQIEILNGTQNCPYTNGTIFWNSYTVPILKSNFDTCDSCAKQNSRSLLKKIAYLNSTKNFNNFSYH